MTVGLKEFEFSIVIKVAGYILGNRIRPLFWETHGLAVGLVGLKSPTR